MVKVSVGIVTNRNKDPDLSYTKMVAAWLEARNYTPVLEEELAYSSKFLIVLGGDGTMLQAAHKAARCSTPMLGINLGNLGYLTDADRHDGLEAIEKMLAGNFTLEQRMMLEVRDRLALNEALVLREGSPKLMAFRISVDGKHMDTLRADGVIVATPTGSTAYNLSAGGPILRPDSEMIIVTAICPHTLYARPWVFSGNHEVSITPAEEEEAVVFLDGEAKFSLNFGESIEVRRSIHTADVVKTSGMDFFEILRRKMVQ